MRVVLDCPKCGYRYTAMWYEPTWLALRVCKKSHEDFCATGIADGYPKLWHQQGVEAERERIIWLMREQICECDEMTGAEMEERFGKKNLLRHINHTYDADIIRWQISVIKGEEK
jgi:hypothetical protein